MGSTPPVPESDYLDSEVESHPPQAQRPERPGWQVTPATYLLVGINCLVFLLMLAMRVNFFNPDPEQLLAFGANHAGRVLVDGEWWRVVTATFVHVGIIHLATNMWCLWNLGMLAESLAGSAGVLMTYVLSGAAGNLLSIFVAWTWPNAANWLWKLSPALANLIWPIHDGAQFYFPVGAGASGAVFGLAGLLIVLLKSQRLPVPADEVRKLRRSVIYFAVINFAIGIASIFPGLGVRIDNMAHLGGFCGGLLFAAPMVPRIGSERGQFLRRRRWAVVLVIGVLVLFAFFLVQLPG